MVNQRLYNLNPRLVLSPEPLTPNSQPQVLHYAASFDDDDIACELLSYSIVAVAKPFHWFTTEDPATHATPHQIAARYSSVRVSTSYASQGAETLPSEEMDVSR